MISMEILKLIVDLAGVIVGALPLWFEYRKQRASDERKREVVKWEWD